MKKISVKSEKGKLGILIPGLGAVGTTFIAGVIAIRKGLAKPIGSLTQMAHIRLGKRSEHRSPKINELLPFVPLDNLYFGGWDIFEDNVYQSAINAKVLEKQLLEQIREELENIKPMAGVFSTDYVKNLKGKHIKKASTKYELAELLREDIRNFKAKHNLDRMVMIWAASTEIFITRDKIHETLEDFEKGMKENHPAIAPSMLYAWAALKEGVPFANGAPNLTVDIPALIDLSHEMNVPVAGKDFKTGQTLMKTTIAPVLKARMLGLKGWFSTNILGNRDGEVLDDPSSFKTKEESKLGVLHYILQPDLYPDLYNNVYHKVRINYYPPSGDNKEGWDNLDIFGWLGYPMQIKINFLCRDSILAAPIVLDLALFLDLSQRAGLIGIQEWLSFYWKSPIYAPGLYPEHDIFIQLTKLKNTLRLIAGEEQITHIDKEYYE
jgi:myo-inositol-1-phosphate synthase